VCEAFDSPALDISTLQSLLPMVYIVYVLFQGYEHVIRWLVIFFVRYLQCATVMFMS